MFHSFANWCAFLINRVSLECSPLLFLLHVNEHLLFLVEVFKCNLLTSYTTGFHDNTLGHFGFIFKILTLWLLQFFERICQYTYDKLKFYGRRGTP